MSQPSSATVPSFSPFEPNEARQLRRHGVANERTKNARDKAALLDAADEDSTTRRLRAQNSIDTMKALIEDQYHTIRVETDAITDRAKVREEAQGVAEREKEKSTSIAKAWTASAQKSHDRTLVDADLRAEDWRAKLRSVESAVQSELESTKSGADEELASKLAELELSDD